MPSRGVFQAFQESGKLCVVWCRGRKVQLGGDNIGSAATPDPLVDSWNHVAHMDNLTLDWGQYSAAEQNLLRGIVLLVEGFCC